MYVEVCGRADVYEWDPRVKSDQKAEVDVRFTALVERHSRRLFQIAYGLLRNSHDAEDAVQDTLLKVYRTGAWRRIEDEKAYLNQAVWRMASGRILKRTAIAEDLEEQSTGPDIERDLIEADFSAFVHRLIDRLPEELRQPLALSTIEEMNSREIAATMGIPEGTVRTRLMRARQILRSRLERVKETRHGTK
jgi:RNA polymerase sigma-70 factor (ECF subfamily)